MSPDLSLSLHSRHTPESSLSVTPMANQLPMSTPRQDAMVGHGHMKQQGLTPFSATDMMVRSMATSAAAACAISAAATSSATASPSRAEPSGRRGPPSSGAGAAPKMAGLDDLLLEPASTRRTELLTSSHSLSGICNEGAPYLRSSFLKSFVWMMKLQPFWHEWTTGEGGHYIMSFHLLVSAVDDYEDVKYSVVLSH